MKTNRYNKIFVAGLFIVAILCTRFASRAGTIAGPYTNDAFTLHLWHMDASAVPVPDAAPGGTNLAKLANGATLGNTSFSGFGNALSTLDGGENGISATSTDAYMTPSSAATPGIVSITLADPVTGAFTMEALVWIGFDPAKNLGTTGVGGNGRNSPCQILSGESNTSSNRVFQFRIAPIQTANANTTVRLEFNNVNLGGTSQLLSIPLPTTGPDAIASNSWYHVAVTYNGIANTTSNFNFYWTLLDPTRTNADLLMSTNNVRSLPVAETVFGLGNIPGRTINNNFLGLIDEVRISSVARSPYDMMFSGPAPAIPSASQPASQSVALGQPATFGVTALGLDPLSYQWQVNSTNIPGATANTFTIASTQLTDAGPYDVVITNNYGSVTSSVAMLSVGSPVTVGSPQPTNQVVAVGQSASLTVTPSGASPFFYQWRQGGTNLAGATQSVYSITSAQLTNTGLYDVIVTNSFGSATSTVATITVRTPLNLTWLGQSSSDWNTNDVNWITDTSEDVAYTTGDNVTFNDSGNGASAVALDVPVSPSSVVVSADNNYTLSSLVGAGIVGSSQLTQNGPGTLVVDIDNSYTGPTVVQGGILQLGVGDAHGTFGQGPVTNNAVIVMNRTGLLNISNVLTGPGSITNQLPGGTIFISGTNNTLSGPITLNAGTLSLVGPQAIGNTTNFTLNAQTVTSGNSTIMQVAGGITLGPTITLSMLGTVDVPDYRCSFITGSDGSTNIVNCGLVLGGSGLEQFQTGTGEMDIYSSISQPDFTGKLVFRGTTGVGHFYGSINVPNANHVTKTDPGTWVLHSTGNFWTNGNIGGGTFRIAANNAMPAGVILQIGGSGATLDLNGFNQQIGGLVDGTSTEIVANSSTNSDSILTVSSALFWLFTGVIEDSVGGGTHKVGLTVNGGGILSLAGTNTYSGDTTISAGVLALIGSGAINSTNGGIIIAGGATFDVSSVIAQPYHVRTGKTLRCGDVTGGATINGALNENGGGFLALNYAAGTPALNMTGGALTLNGCATTVNVLGAALGAGSYTLISAGAGGSVNGTLPPAVTVAGGGLAPGTTASLSITSGQLVLNVTVPQPVIAGTSYNGTSFIFSGTNGTPGNTYYVLTSTNAAAPLATWTPVYTNVFDVNGAFSVTNAVSPAAPARFYLLKLP